MRRLLDVRDAEQERFANHPVFARMEREPIEVLVPVLGYGAGFWAMGFQDLLRVIHETVEAPPLRAYARHHREEDAGHQLWLLHDLAQYGYGPGSRVLDFYEQDNFPARLHTYKILSEALRLRDDRLRVALLLAVESAGHVFFGWMSRLIAERGVDRELKYFGPGHIAVEKAHTVFESTSEDDLRRLELEPAAAREGVDMVKRVHASFTRFAEDVVALLDDPQWVAQLCA